MNKRLGVLGTFVAVAGVGFLAAGAVAYVKVQDGYDSLQAFSETQDVTLSYNEDGELVDRGTVEGAQAIKSLLTDDWQYPVVESDLDPNDPLVNTASEYMYQMATVVYHTLHGTQTIVLDEAVEYNGETFPAGEYEFAVDGRYWTDFDRNHPIEGKAREMAWTGTAHGIVAELGVGTVTHSTLQMGLALAGVLAGLGLVFLVTGIGLVWVGRGQRKAIPDTIPPSPPPQLVPLGKGWGTSASTGRLEIYIPFHGADWFRRQSCWTGLRPELLRLAKRGTNKNCR